MGLIKLAVVGGAGYWAVNRYRQNRNKTQNAPQQPPQQSPHQQYRDHPYQPDYYSDHPSAVRQPDYHEYKHDPIRSADKDMFGPNSEKRQYYPTTYAAPERQSHEKPLQLNFVAPSEKTMAQMSGADATASYRS